MKKIDPNATEERKTALRTLCEIDSYLPVISECLTPEQKKVLRSEHMASALSLVAELFLTNYDGIAAAFERNNTLAIDFKVVLAPEKDTVTIQYKPVEVYKDSASVNLPIEDEPELPGIKPQPAAPVKAKDEPIEAEILQIGAPAPEPIALGAPADDGVIDAETIPGTESALTEEQQAHIESVRDQGMDARSEGQDRNTSNPFPFQSMERAIWYEGFDAQHQFILKAAGLADEPGVDPNAPIEDVPPAPAEKPKRQRKTKPAEQPNEIIVEPETGPGPEPSGGFEIVEEEETSAPTAD